MKVQWTIALRSADGDSKIFQLQLEFMLVWQSRFMQIETDCMHGKVKSEESVINGIIDSSMAFSCGNYISSGFLEHQ